MHPIRGGKKDEVIFLLLRQEYTYKVNYLSCYKSRPRLGDAGPSTRGLFSFVDQLLYFKTVAAKLYIIPFQKKLYIIFLRLATLYILNLDFCRRGRRYLLLFFKKKRTRKSALLFYVYWQTVSPMSAELSVSN